MSGPFRSFETWWESLSETTKQRMNKADASLVWMTRAIDVKAAKLQGRKEALKELIYELDSTDRFRERDLVQSFYKTDVSYSEEQDNEN